MAAMWTSGSLRSHRRHGTQSARARTPWHQRAQGRAAGSRRAHSRAWRPVYDCVQNSARFRGYRSAVGAAQSSFRGGGAGPPRFRRDACVDSPTSRSAWSSQAPPDSGRASSRYEANTQRARATVSPHMRGPRSAPAGGKRASEGEGHLVSTRLPVARLRSNSGSGRSSLSWHELRISARPQARPGPPDGRLGRLSLHVGAGTTRTARPCEDGGSPTGSSHPSPTGRKYPYMTEKRPVGEEGSWFFGRRWKGREGAGVVFGVFEEVGAADLEAQRVEGAGIEA